MEKEDIGFVPKWQGEIEGWAVNFCKSQEWRTEPEHGMDDLLQDAYVFFLICCKTYPEVVDAPHFMALFQSCMRNHINDLALKRTRRKELSYDAIENDVYHDAEDPSNPFEDVEFELLVDEAPDVVQRIVTLGAKKKLKSRAGVRETTKQYIERLYREAGGRELLDEEPVDLVMNYLGSIITK